MYLYPRDNVNRTLFWHQCTKNVLITFQHFQHLQYSNELTLADMQNICYPKVPRAVSWLFSVAIIFFQTISQWICLRVHLRSKEDSNHGCALFKLRHVYDIIAKYLTGPKSVKHDVLINCPSRLKSIKSMSHKADDGAIGYPWLWKFLAKENLLIMSPFLCDFKEF